MIAGTVFGTVGSSPDTGRMGFGRYVGASTSSKVKTVVADADKMSMASAESGHDTYSPDVNAFIAENGLDGFMEQVVDAASEAFGYAIRLDPYIFEDPETGIPVLSIRILVRNLRASRAPFSRFCHSWWYNQIAKYGGKVSLKVAQDSGL